LSEIEVLLLELDWEVEATMGVADWVEDGGDELVALTGGRVVDEITTDEVVDDGDVTVDEELEADEVELPTTDALNSRTLLSRPSLTHRLPEESIATPSSPYMSDCETLKALAPAAPDMLVKFGWPITKEALSFNE
jgi:hypothetical protein